MNEDASQVLAIAQTLLQDFLVRASEGPFLRDLAVQLDDALASEVPQLASDEAIRADLDASTLELLNAFFAAVAGDPTRTFGSPPAVLRLARTTALRRYDIGVLLRAYRVGQRLAWAEFVRILTPEIPDPELRLSVLNVLFNQISLQIERTVDESVAVFTEERDRWLSGTLARKTETIQALLRGDSVDVDEATRTLGHRLKRHQLAFLFWVEGSTADAEATRVLETATQDLARLLGSPPPLTIPDGARSLQVWVNLTPRQDGAALDQLLGSGLRIAAGLPAYGAAGFRASHRQAVLAARVAQASSSPQRVTRYADVELVGAFLHDPDSMRELVARELGGLAVRDEPTRRLRQTTLAYLRKSGNARDAAEAIGVHKNTVLYRLRQIEEILGRPIEERRLPLEVALEIAEQLGDGVLPA